jgi:hypothetical protein
MNATIDLLKYGGMQSRKKGETEGDVAERTLAYAHLLF